MVEGGGARTFSEISHFVSFTSAHFIKKKKFAAHGGLSERDSERCSEENVIHFSEIYLKF